MRPTVGPTLLVLGGLIVACGEEAPPRRAPVLAAVQAIETPAEAVEDVDDEAAPEGSRGREEDDEERGSQEEWTPEDEDSPPVDTLTPTQVAHLFEAWHAHAPSHLALVATLKKGDGLAHGLEAEVELPWRPRPREKPLLALRLNVLHVAGTACARSTECTSELVVGSQRLHGALGPDVLPDQAGWRAAVEADLRRTLDLPELARWLREVRGWKSSFASDAQHPKELVIRSRAERRVRTHASAGAVAGVALEARVGENGALLGLRVEVRRWAATAGLADEATPSRHWAVAFPVNRPLEHPDELGRELVSEGAPMPGTVEEIVATYDLTRDDTTPSAALLALAARHAPR